MIQYSTSWDAASITGFSSLSASSFCKVRNQSDTCKMLCLIVSQRYSQTFSKFSVYRCKPIPVLHFPKGLWAYSIQWFNLAFIWTYLEFSRCTIRPFGNLSFLLLVLFKHRKLRIYVLDGYSILWNTCSVRYTSHLFSFFHNWIFSYISASNTINRRRKEFMLTKLMRSSFCFRWVRHNSEIFPGRLEDIGSMMSFSANFLDIQLHFSTSFVCPYISMQGCLWYLIMINPGNALFH